MMNAHPLLSSRRVRPALLLLLAAGACAHAAAPAAPPAAPAASNLALVAAAATLPIGSQTTPAAKPAAALGCLIEASATVDIGTPVIGVLTMLAVERGDVVKKDQVLAKIDGSVEHAAVQLAQTRVGNQADIDSALNQRNYATRKALRTAELTHLQFVSAQAREQADTEATMAGMKLAQTLEQQTMAKQELALARAQLAQRTVRSPLNGVVVERYTAVGERIENRPILKLAQIDPLRVEVVMPASRFNFVKVGMTAQVLPELQGTRAQLATVAIVDRVIDASSNTFRVRLTLPNRDLNLPSGVRCKVEFEPSRDH